jgi:hypothetical protein
MKRFYSGNNTLHRHYFYDSIIYNTVEESMRLFSKFKYAGRLLLTSVMIAVTVISSIPATARAETPPIDLQLDSAAYTPIIGNDIKPGDSGIKTVQLHNAGSKSGFVSIWVSDIINGEGLNPESETGDTTGFGQLDAYFTLDLSVAGLDTSLNLPASIKDLPKSDNSREYISVIPLKAGQTKTLDWHWELPADTGNEVQGDNLTFSINYLLREAAITDVSGSISAGGVFTRDVTILSEENEGKMVISENTTATTADNKTPTDMWLIKMDNEPPAPPTDKTIAGLYYDAGPSGTTFDKPLTLTVSYLPKDIPAGVSELELYITLWDETTSQWVALPNCVVDTNAKTISAEITHFSRYTVQCRKPASVPVYIPPVIVTDEESDKEDTGGNKLAVNLLDEESLVDIGEDGTLEESLVLGDPDGNYSIDIKAGTRVTGTGGIRLGRIELEIVDIYMVLPDNTETLSPVYKLTGYTVEGEVTDITFDPLVTLKIRYNPDDLPENSYLPFLAIYTDKDGLVPLEISEGSIVEPGWAQGLINSGGLFFAAAEAAPPPQPLPAHFRATSLIISPEETKTGKPVSISVTITNDGDTSGSYELYLTIDGIVRATQLFDLNARSSKTLTFEISNLSVGTHQVQAAGLIGSVKVDRLQVQPLGAGVNWLILDLGVALVVTIGLIVWLYFFRRARQQSNTRYQI